MKNESYRFSTTSTLLGWKNCCRMHRKTLMDNVARTAEALRLAQPAKEVLFRRQTQVIALCSQGEGISKGPTSRKLYWKFKSCFESSMAIPYWTGQEEPTQMKISHSFFCFKPTSVVSLGAVICTLVCLWKGGDSAIEAIPSCSADRFPVVSTSTTRDLSSY